MEPIIPSHDHANELDLAPNWLSIKDKRATIDVFFPSLPLAVSLRGFWKKKEWVFVENTLLQLRCPHIVFNWRDKITTDILLRHLNTITQTYPLELIHEIKNYV